MVEYHVPVSAGGVANIFDLLEASKETFKIRHFSVSQTTLEEVRMCGHPFWTVNRGVSRLMVAHNGLLHTIDYILKGFPSIFLLGILYQYYCLQIAMLALGKRTECCLSHKRSVLPCRCWFRQSQGWRWRAGLWIIPQLNARHPGDRFFLTIREICLILFFPVLYLDCKFMEHYSKPSFHGMFLSLSLGTTFPLASEPCRKCFRWRDS